jgi:prepilin-type N-terminal cleavage/methylation domain-containing protein
MKPLMEIRSGRKFSGFTLVELLTVMSITTILLLLITSGLKSAFGTAFGSEANDLASTLVRARAYAMANNTYVYVGIAEVSAATPSASTQTAGNGRIGVVVVATNDGSRGYDPTTTSSSTALPQSPAFAGTQLVVVSPLRHFDNVHITPLTATSITALGASYPIAGTTGNTIPYYDLATSSPVASVSKTTFTWPLTGSQYAFGSNPGSVIQFNPEGQAQIITGANTDSYLQWIQIDLVPTHGTSVPATLSNQTSILIDGASGSVSIYRT